MTVDARLGLSFALRRARTVDVAAIRHPVDSYWASRNLLSKETVTLYQDVREFWVADDPAGGVIGCGALQLMWDDLAEVRTLATDPRRTGRGVWSSLLSQLLSVAHDLGVSHVFCLTFEVDFFARNGFEVLEDTQLEPEVYAQLLRSNDEGVAEFLDLDQVQTEHARQHAHVASALIRPLHLTMLPFALGERRNWSRMVGV